MWMQPKTNWRPNEFFNIQDYNRIKDNLKEIHTQATVLWPDFALEDMGADKGYSDYTFYADEINRFESNLEKICVATCPFAIGDRQVFYDNQPFIDWKELNRIESACLTIHENLKGQFIGRPRMQFRLGQWRNIC